MLRTVAAVTIGAAVIRSISCDLLSVNCSSVSDMHGALLSCICERRAIHSSTGKAAEKESGECDDDRSTGDGDDAVKTFADDFAIAPFVSDTGESRVDPVSQRGAKSGSFRTRGHTLGRTVTPVLR